MKNIETWRDAAKLKMIQFGLPKESGRKIGYCVTYWLWSADIWFGRVPLLKSLVAANILVWFLFV